MRRQHRVLTLLASLLALCNAGAAAPPDPVAARARLLQLADSREFDAPGFEALAAHPDAGVRIQTARVLAGTGDPRVAATLERLARDREALVRAAAAEAAGRLAGRAPGLADEPALRKLESVLVRLLADRAPEVRRAAAWGLAAGGFARAGKAMLAALATEREAAVRAAIVCELWRVAGREWVPAATAAAGDADPRVRFAAAWSLARDAKAEAVPGLRRALGDADPSVQTAALQGAKRGLARELWDGAVVATQHADARVRIAAFEAVAEAAARDGAPRLPDGVVAACRAAVTDTDPTRTHLRVAAIRLAGVSRCCPAELRMCLAGGESWIAGEALVALVRSGDGDGQRAAVAWATAAEAARRGVAARALRWGPTPLAALQSLAADADRSVRIAALEGVAELPDAGAPAVLERALDDPDAAVRATAIEALAARKALPEAAVVLARLRLELAAAESDAALAWMGLIGKAGVLVAPAREVLRGALTHPDPVVARAAWAALRAAGVASPRPVVRRDAALDYSGVVAWAARERYLEMVTQRGTMQIRLDTANAPLAAFRLSRLADEKFFDGLTFHRVVPDFVAQGGDPRGDGWGGPGFTLRDELTLQSYEAGTVGLAHSGPDTAGSQLFVTLTPQPHLDGRYPVLGRVVNGVDVAERLRVGDRILRVKGSEQLAPYFPIWYGAIDPGRLDREMPGWREEGERYAANAATVGLLATARLRYEIVVAMGTWCGDSREQIPRLQRILRALGDRSPFTAVRLVGVDRGKWIDPATWRFGTLDKVPTIVVTAGGAEIGRIVETPTPGSTLEGDLARILATVEGWDVPQEEAPRG